MKKPKWVKISGERSRTYKFPHHEWYTFKNVVLIEIRESGKHRLEMQDGSKGIVNSGWLVIEIDADAWSV